MAFEIGTETGIEMQQITKGALFRELLIFTWFCILFLKVIKNMYGIDNRLGSTFDTKHTAVNA